MEDDASCMASFLVRLLAIVRHFIGCVRPFANLSGRGGQDRFFVRSLPNWLGHAASKAVFAVELELPPSVEPRLCLGGRLLLWLVALCIVAPLLAFGAGAGAGGDDTSSGGTGAGAGARSGAGGGFDASIAFLIPSASSAVSSTFFSASCTTQFLFGQQTLAEPRMLPAWRHAEPPCLLEPPGSLSSFGPLSGHQQGSDHRKS